MNPPLAHSPILPFARYVLAAVFALHLGFSFTYNAIIPLFRGPDEQSHYVYIQHLVKYHSLPRITRPDDPTGTRDERDGAIAIHPPLYYVTALPVYLLASPLGDEWRQRALRLLATAFALGTLVFILRIARLLFPNEIDTSHGVVEELEGGEHRPVMSLIPHQLADAMQANTWMQIAVVGFAALLPHFLLLSSVINNDGLFILLNTALLLFIVQAVVSHSPTPPLISIGMVFGLCLLTKASAVSIIPLMIIVALMHSWEGTEYSIAKWARNFLLIFGPALLIAGWWYAWYFHVHHRLYFIPKDVRFGPPLRYDSIVDFIADPQGACVAVWRFLVGISKSIWSQVDWILPNDPNHPEQATSAMYPLSYLMWLAFMVQLVGAIAMNLLLGLATRTHWTPRHRADSLMYVHFALYFFALMYSTLFIHPGGYQGGRYLLPSIAAFSVLMLAPWSFWQHARGPHESRRASMIRLTIPLLFVLPLILLNFMCIQNLLRFLIPVYAH